MRFTPKTEKEIAEENLLPKGEYNYEVIAAEEKRSKSGNEMIAVKLRIFAGEDGGPTLTDYLMEAMARKLRNFCAQNGLLREYESGTLCAEDCIGKSGVAYVKIEKDKTGAYPDKNAIADYPVKRGASAGGGSGAPPTFDSGPASDDDVPFMRYEVPCI
jgi:hypothetical protein